MKKRAVVVGAGIAGLTSAYYLAKAGYKVIVYEQERYPAMRCSHANGGQISVSNSEVWNTWTNVNKGIKWMFTKDAPLLIRPRFDPAMFSWISKFLWHTARGDYKKNTEWTIRTGIESSKLYKQIITEEKLEFDQTNSGILHFYKNGEYHDRAYEAAKLFRKNGCEWENVTAGEFYKLEPALQDIKGVVGGGWTSTDWTGDINKFCIELEKVLKAMYGVKFHYNKKIDTLKRFSHDVIVVANGVGSVKLAKSIGDSLPIYPVKGYSITINNVNPKYLPSVSLLDDEAKIVTATLGNKLRIAGTAELTGENYDIRRDRIEPLLKWVHTNFPNIDTHDYNQWACLRPMTPNMLPIVKQSKKDNRVFYHTGHGHLGWTLSPATAKQLVELIESCQ